ncbi:MAG: SpoIIE family protein phosphatase [Treponema sp.]|nr:SpoIIE family protein phosphatase [Treponema sp.]
MNLKYRILLQTLSASIIFMMLISIMFFHTTTGIRNSVLTISGELGDSAADISVYALEGHMSDASLIEKQIHSLTVEAITSIDRQIYTYAWIISITLFIGFIAISVFSIKFTSGVVRPILALNDGVHEVSGGNLEREVIIKTGDELEELATSFNIMTGRIREQIEKIAMANAEKEKLNSELDAAARIQSSMLPSHFPPFSARRNDFDLCAAVFPAKEVGGDFYDFFFIDDDHFAIIIADVSGKGIPAAIFMAVVKTMIKNNLKSEGRPDLAMDNINRQLCNANTAYMFVTLWFGILEISSGKFSYINAGHNPPLMRRSSGEFKLMESPPDLVLAGLDNTLYHCRETFLDDGDVVFLYTDGIVEAADSQGNFYGVKRLLDFMNGNTGLSCKKIIPALLADIHEYSSGVEQYDDITMLMLRLDREKHMRYITLAADQREIDKLMDFLGHDLNEGSCPQKVRCLIELAAEEVFVNIINYAYQSYAGEIKIGSGIQRIEEKTVFTVTFADHGEPFNPLEHQDPDLSVPIEQREIGGLGVLMVKRTMDTISYEYDEGVNRLLIKKSW